MCERVNHFDCIHPASDHNRPSTAGLLTYLDGWTTVSELVKLMDDESDGTPLNQLIEYLEQNGCVDDHDRGVRDAIIVAYGVRDSASAN